jgi:hypothetical protein
VKLREGHRPTVFEEDSMLREIVLPTRAEQQEAGEN